MFLLIMAPRKARLEMSAAPGAGRFISGLGIIAKSAAVFPTGFPHKIKLEGVIIKMSNPDYTWNPNNKDSRIICDVTNCVYNNEKKLCTAQQIKVGPQYASSSADTICVTFKP